MGHGPIGADEAYLPVRGNVTRGLADSCAKPITVVVVTAKKMVNTKQSTRTLTVSSGMSRRARGGNGASALQVVRSFLELSACISTWCRGLTNFLHKSDKLVFGPLILLSLLNEQR